MSRNILREKYPKAELPASFRSAKLLYSNGSSTTKAWGVKYFFRRRINGIPKS